MSRFTKQQLHEAAQKLPPHIKEIIFSEDRADSFHEIMERNSLTVAQMAAVADTLAPVTFGLVHPKHLPIELRRALPMLPAESIDKLVADINATLLAPIRAHILELSQQREHPTTTSSDQTVPETPSNDETPTTPAPQTNIAEDKLAAPQRSSQETVTIKKNLYGATPDPYREPVE